MATPTIAQSALSTVNKARVAIGLARLRSLPKGDVCQATTCPLAIALDAHVDEICASFKTKKAAKTVAMSWGEKAVGHLVLLPDNLAHFVNSFDNGDLPELVATE